MTREFITIFLAPMARIVPAQAATPTPSSNYATTSIPTLDVEDEEEDDDDDDSLFWWEAGANIKSHYLWRGYDQSYYGYMFDPAIQPSVTLGLGAFYVDLWFNSPTISTYQELAMTLGFDYENLSVTLYDLLFDYGKAFW